MKYTDKIQLRLIRIFKKDKYYYLQYRKVMEETGVLAWLKNIFKSDYQWKHVTRFYPMYSKMDPDDPYSNPNDSWNWGDVSVDVTEEDPENHIQSLRRQIKTYGDLIKYYHLDSDHQRYLVEKQKWDALRNMKKIY